MTLGSATTVVAFFCLQFAKAAVLRDVGLFAGFSLIGAAVCTLVFLPHFIPAKLFSGQNHDSWMEKISFSALDSNRYIALGILLATPVFLFFAQRVKFNSDMSKLNFMHTETAAAQHRLESISRSSLTSIYVVSSGSDLQDALKKNERTIPVLERL
jgi:predicted exporter